MLSDENPCGTWDRARFAPFTRVLVASWPGLVLNSHKGEAERPQTGRRPPNLRHSSSASDAARPAMFCTASSVVPVRLCASHRWDADLDTWRPRPLADCSAATCDESGALEARAKPTVARETTDAASSLSCLMQRGLLSGVTRSAHAQLAGVAAVHTFHVQPGGTSALRSMGASRSVDLTAIASEGGSRRMPNFRTGPWTAGWEVNRLRRSCECDEGANSDESAWVASHAGFRVAGHGVPR